MNEHNFTNAPASTVLPEISLEQLDAFMRRFQDRMPATLRAIKVHPAYYAIFAQKLKAILPPSLSDSEISAALQSVMYMEGIPILQDENVEFGRVRYVFAGDPDA